MKGNIYCGKKQMFEHSKVITNHYSAKRDMLFYLLLISTRDNVFSEQSWKKKLYKPK